jgi:hypothetical protein
MTTETTQRGLLLMKTTMKGEDLDQPQCSCWKCLRDAREKAWDAAAEEKLRWRLANRRQRGAHLTRDEKQKLRERGLL